VGAFVGELVGVFVGEFVGPFVGLFVGEFVGELVGLFVGELVGLSFADSTVTTSQNETRSIVTDTAVKFELKSPSKPNDPKKPQLQLYHSKPFSSIITKNSRNLQASFPNYNTKNKKQKDIIT